MKTYLKVIMHSKLQVKATHCVRIQLLITDLRFLFKHVFTHKKSYEFDYLFYKNISKL